MSIKLDSNNNQKKEQKNNLAQKEKKENEDLTKLLILNIKKTSFFPTSSYCYLFISIGLFILGCQSTGWCDYGSTFINSAFLFIGICQYILGLYDWYQGYNILYMQNIVFGIWYMSFFLNNFEINGIKKPKHIFSYFQGITDLIMLVFVSIIAILVKGKGIAYTIDYFLLFFCFSFLALSGYSTDYQIIIKISGYVFFTSFIFFWLTGISLIINDVFNDKIIKFVEPRLQ